MRRKVIQISVLAMAFMALAAVLFALPYKGILGYAVFQDSSQSDFNQGTYNFTYYNGSAVVLSSGNSSGNYTSRIFDAGWTATWNSLSLTSGTPTAKLLYAVDGAGDVYRSADSGVTWTQMINNYGRTTDTEDLFSNSNYLFIISSSNKEVWRSSNYGVSWSVINNTLGDGSAFVLAESDSNGNLWIADGSGDVYKSTDSGISWTKLGDFNGGSANNGKGMAIRSDGRMFIVDSSGAVWSSTDGNSWTEQSSGYGGGAATDDLEVDSGNDLYILNNKQIYKSLNDGVNWLVINNSFTSYSQDGLEMFIDSNDNFYVIDSTGRVFKSTNSGASWSETGGDFNGGATNDIKGFNSFSAASNLSVLVKNCSSANCADGTWQSKNIANLNLVGRYFQYRLVYSSPSSSFSPYVSGANLNYNPVDSTPPTISFGAQTTASGTYSNQGSINVAVSLSDASQIYSFINFNNSLMLFYKMNESSGTIRDYSGNSRNGTYNGALYNSSGQYGNSLGFDGVNDYINTPLYLSGLSKFTLSAWYYRDFASDRFDISECENNNQDRVKLIRHGDGLIYGVVQSGAASSYGTFSDSSTGWINLVLVYDGTQSTNAGKLKIYKNGVEQTLSFTGTLPSTMPSFTNSLKIGYDVGANVYGKGRADEVLVFNRALSSTEVSELYSASTFSKNFTSLSYGSYNFYAYAQDVYGNDALTETRNVVLSANTPPTIVLDEPAQDSIYGYNTSINLKYAVSDADSNLDKCWYVLNGGASVNLASCGNTTINVPTGNNLIYVFANDTVGGVSNDSASFSVSIGAPSISLSSPSNGAYLNSKKVDFVFSATDPNLDSCSLWGNFTGTYAFNQTLPEVKSGAGSTFSLDLNDGTYIWSISCNDTGGLVSSTNNQTLHVDTTSPTASISQPSGTVSSRTGIVLSVNVVDASPVSCVFSVYQGASLAVANTSVSCSGGTFNVSSDADYILYLYMNDSAGNTNSTSSSFSVSTSTQSSPSSGDEGGGGGGGSIFVPAKNEESKANVEFSGDKKLVVKRGTSEDFKIEVVNKEKVFLNNCHLVFDGASASWASSSTEKGLSPGERFSYDAKISVPEGADPGSHALSVGLQCEEGAAYSDFEITTYRYAFEADISDYERVDNLFKAKYVLTEYSGIDHNIVAQYRLVDLDGVSRYNGQLEMVLGAHEEKSGEIEFDLPKDSFGEFVFVLDLNDGLTQVIENEQVFLPSKGVLSGFAISEENKKTLSIFGFVVVGLIFVVLVAYLIVRFRKRKNKEKVLKESKFDKRKSHKRFLELEL